jgi:hypothetical protein
MPPDAPFRWLSSLCFAASQDDNGRGGKGILLNAASIANGAAAEEALIHK